MSTVTLPSFFLERSLQQGVSTSRDGTSTAAAAAAAGALADLPFSSFDYQKVFGACCENVIGYVTCCVMCDVCMCSVVRYVCVNV